MKTKDIYNYINKIAPFTTAMPFDNVGLLIGDTDDDVSGVMLCLDVTFGVVRQAAENNCNLIVSHHPVIFDPLSKIEKHTVLWELVQNNISVISAHTNLDAAENGVVENLCDALNMSDIKPLCDPRYPDLPPIARSGVIPNPMPPKDFAVYVKECLDTSAVRVKYGNKPVKNIAVASGSGGSLTTQGVVNGFDAFVVGEIKHEHWLSMENTDMTIIEAGHFITEAVFKKPLAEKMEKDLSLKIILADERLIYTYA